MNKVYIKNKKLVIEVPLIQKRFSPFDETLEWEGENIIGLIEPNQHDIEYGFAYRIDMSYKGKADQWSDIFYKWHSSLEDFKKFCEKHKLDIFEYEQCAYCKETIYGCHTIGKDGSMCMDCENKLR